MDSGAAEMVGASLLFAALCEGPPIPGAGDGFVLGFHRARQGRILAFRV